MERRVSCGKEGALWKGVHSHHLDGRRADDRRGARVAPLEEPRLAEEISGAELCDLRRWLAGARRRLRGGLDGGKM